MLVDHAQFLAVPVVPLAQRRCSKDVVHSREFPGALVLPGGMPLEVLFVEARRQAAKCPKCIHTRETSYGGWMTSDRVSSESAGLLFDFLLRFPRRPRRALVVVVHLALTVL